MISLQSVINNVVNFYSQHKQVKKVGTDFKEQIFNFATQDEKYPIIFIY